MGNKVLIVNFMLFVPKFSESEFLVKEKEDILKYSGLFSNQVARFTSDCQVEEVAARLKAIEREAGRKPDEKKREIVRLDIDVLSCDTLVYKPDDLKRDYVVRGLKELELTSFV